jgi:hypothetical protein
MTNGTYIFRETVLPEDIKETIDNYVRFGIPTGHFLQACIDNNLDGAIGRADERSLEALPAIVGYLHNHTPWDCHGYQGAHDRHVKNKLRERKRKAEDQ